MKTIIVGLGNTSFSDDGAGLLVARTIKGKILDKDTAVVEASVAGLDILDIIADFEKAVIIDAVQTEDGKPGSIYRFDLDQLFFLKEGSPHHIDFLTSFYLAKKLELPLPGEVILFGIEAQTIDQPNEGCTPPVAAAIPLCVEKIMTELVAEQAVGDYSY